MRAYLVLGILFIILVIVSGAIVFREGAYEVSGVLSSNTELIGNVSFTEESVPSTSSFTDGAPALLHATAGSLSSNTPSNDDVFDSDDSRETSDDVFSDPYETYTPPDSSDAPSFPEIVRHEVSVSAPVFPIDINTASLDELQNITGVGPVISQRIIDDRRQNGPFYDIGEIRRVNGIGDATFEKMRYEITVGNVVRPLPPPLPPPVISDPVVPDPIPEPESSLPEMPPASSKININTASETELQTITGIGPVLSGRIVEYRTLNGPFQSVDDLVNVKGIGPATLEKMRNEITL